MVKGLIDTYNVSEAAVLKEIQLGMVSLIQSQEKLFGAGAIRTAFHIPGADDELWRDGQELSRKSVDDVLAAVYQDFYTDGEDIDKEFIDVHRYRITLVMRILYEYVTKARFPNHVVFSDILEDAKTFVDSVYWSQEYYGLTENEMPICKGIIHQAIARGILDTQKNEFFRTIWTDEGGPSYLDVARLAQLDIRTVRNAASKNEFETFKEEGKTLIDPVSANDWLKIRGDFKSTEIYDIEEVIEHKNHLNKLEKENEEEYLNEREGHWIFHKKRTAPVLKLVVNNAPPENAEKIVENTKKVIRTKYVTLSKTNAKNNSFSVRSILDHISKEVIGGANKSEIATNKLSIEFPDGTLISTDVDGSKNILRNRSAIRKFYKNNNLGIGSEVRVLWLENNYLRLEPVKNRGDDYEKR